MTGRVMIAAIVMALVLGAAGTGQATVSAGETAPGAARFAVRNEIATLVQTIDTSAFAPNSPDPGGIGWSDSNDHLVVVDSEVNQYDYFTGINLWRVERDGDVESTGTTDGWSGEPTGITIDEDGERFFTSDDVDRAIYEIALGADGIAGSADDALLNQFDTRGFGSTDPEGLAFDTRRGWLYVIDGLDSVFTIKPGANGTFDGGGDDEITSFSTLEAGTVSPEDIAYNALTDRLAVVDYQRAVVTEFSISGQHLRDIHISAAPVIHPGGLTWGDSSDGDGTSLWVVDRGVDLATPSDGMLFEFSVPDAPIISVAPNPVLFAPIGPDIKAVVVANEGTDFLVVNSAGVTGDPAFSVVPVPVPLVLGPGESTEINVRFNGTTRGAHVGSLQLVSTDPNMGTTSVRLHSLSCPLVPAPFTDVSPTSFAMTDIACIYQLGVTTGTSATTYSPNDDVTREQMAAFLARLWRVLGNDCPTGATPFTDVSPTSFAMTDIACIYQLGVTTGTSATTYSPDDDVTREQMAAFLARLFRAYASISPPTGL